MEVILEPHNNSSAISLQLLAISPPTFYPHFFTTAASLKLLNAAHDISIDRQTLPGGIEVINDVIRGYL